MLIVALGDDEQAAALGMVRNRLGPREGRVVSDIAALSGGISQVWYLRRVETSGKIGARHVAHRRFAVCGSRLQFVVDNNERARVAVPDLAALERAIGRILPGQPSSRGPMAGRIERNGLRLVRLGI